MGENVELQQVLNILMAHWKVIPVTVYSNGCLLVMRYFVNLFPYVFHSSPA
jgi:hypothetical protein